MDTGTKPETSFILDGWKIALSRSKKIAVSFDFQPPKRKPVNLSKPI